MRLIDADSLRKKAGTCRETTDAFIELIDMEPTVDPNNIREVSNMTEQCKGQVTMEELLFGSAMNR